MAREKKAAGRPTLYTAAIAAKICARLSTGEPMASICRDEAMPSVSTVGNWKLANVEFSGAIAHAREDGFDAIAADCLNIADDGSNDYVEKEKPDGTKYEAYDAEHVQRSKLRVETRLKLLAKWDPRRYGDMLKLGDPDGNKLGLAALVGSAITSASADEPG